MKAFRVSLTFLYGTGLYFFYIRYVPIVKPFQAVLILVLFLVFVLTAFKLRWGLLFFIFSFPLINNLPYFFGIHEPIPHAPSALVLFLFFFFGWLVNKVFSQERLNLDHPVFRPLALFSLVLICSGLITFWKYANFFPFLSDYVYELVVNVRGGSAGGAIMSTVFFSLNYLTGIAFFLILFNAVQSDEFIKKIVVLLSISTLISLVFGLYQRFGDLKFGNNPISINQGLINATFKDALSFGVYLAVVTPFVLGAIFFFKKAARFFPVVVVMLSLYMVFFTGSKSGLICLLISGAIFFILIVKLGWDRIVSKSTTYKKIATSSLILFFVVAAAIFAFITIKKDLADSRTIIRLKSTIQQNNVKLMLPHRADVLWKMASHILKEYPLTGVGLGGYIIESANYAQEHGVSLGVPESAENYFLQVGAELGVVGFLLVLWIFWEIIRQMRRSYRKVPVDDNRKFLLIGAVAGIIAFFINIQVHTYIGSYEIKYTFWLLVGLVFALGRDGKSEGEKANFGKKFKILGLALVIAFASVHLWNSAHSLSIKGTSERFGFKQDFGYYQDEKTHDGREFRWTKSYGGTTFKVEKPFIKIPILASHPDVRENPVKVRIYIVKDFFRQKRLLEEITLRASIWKTYSFDLSEEIDQEVILLVKVSRTWKPLKILGTPDPRDLGVAIGKIEFEETM